MADTSCRVLRESCSTWVAPSDWKHLALVAPQVRPLEGVQFVEVSLEDGFKLRAATNIHVAAVGALALGKTPSPEACVAAAEAEEAGVIVPEMPTTQALLKEVPSSETHPGAQYRLGSAGTRGAHVADTSLTRKNLNCGTSEACSADLHHWGFDFL